MRVLLISGSTRPRSTNTLALRKLDELDHPWTVGGGQLYGKPVAWLDVANPGRGEGARTQQRTVLGYVGARIIERACVHVTLERTTDPLPITPAEEQQLAAAHTGLVDAVERGSDVGPG